MGYNFGSLGGNVLSRSSHRTLRVYLCTLHCAQQVVIVLYGYITVLYTVLSRPSHATLRVHHCTLQIIIELWGEHHCIQVKSWYSRGYITELSGSSHCNLGIHHCAPRTKSSYSSGTSLYSIVKYSNCRGIHHCIQHIKSLYYRNFTKLKGPSHHTQGLSHLTSQSISLLFRSPSIRLLGSSLLTKGSNQVPVITKALSHGTPEVSSMPGYSPS